MKNVTAHYYLVLEKLQTSFCRKILLSIGKTVSHYTTFEQKYEPIEI